MISGNYFDGKTSKSNPCLVHQTENAIYIYLSDNPDKSIIWDKSLIHSNDFQQHILTIKYNKFPHETLEINGDNAVDFYHELNKNNPINNVKKFWFKNQKKSLLIILTSFIALILGIYFFLIPWLGEQATNLISLETEIEIGQSFATNIESSNTINSKATEKLNEFKNHLKIDDPYPIQLHVIQSNTINAFAIPGGNIYVYSGIINKMDSYEELVALLGHEITHVTHQHSLKSLGRSAASSIFISAIFGDAGGVTTGIMNQANTLKQLNFSRELETEADVKGIEFLKKNHVSAKGMKNLLKLLDEEGSELNKYLEYVSSHPDTKKRIKVSNQYNFSFPSDSTLQRLFEEIKAETQH